MGEMTRSEAEDWCKRNGVEMSFYEKEGEGRLVPYARLEKDDLLSEVEYSQHTGKTAIFEAVRQLEQLMRQAGMKIK